MIQVFFCVNIFVFFLSDNLDIQKFVGEGHLTNVVLLRSSSTHSCVLVMQISSIKNIEISQSLPLKFQAMRRLLLSVADVKYFINTFNILNRKSTTFS